MEASLKFLLQPAAARRAAVKNNDSQLIAVAAAAEDKEEEEEEEESSENKYELKENTNAELEDFAVVFVGREEDLYSGEIIEWFWKQGEGRTFVFVYNNDARQLSPSDFVDDAEIAKYVTVVPWQDHLLTKSDREAGIQCSAYVHFLQNFGSMFKWAAVVDFDEFMMPKQANADSPTIVSILRNKFEPHQSRIHTIAVRRHNFGSSGLQSAPIENKHIWETFTKRSIFPQNAVGGAAEKEDDLDNPEVWNTKSIVNCRFWKELDWSASPHRPSLKKHASSCEAKLYTDEDLSLTCFHFYSKSIEEATLREAIWVERKKLFDTTRTLFDNCENIARRKYLQSTVKVNDMNAVTDKTASVAAQWLLPLHQKTYPLNNRSHKLNAHLNFLVRGGKGAPANNEYEYFTNNANIDEADYRNQQYLAIKKRAIV